jgi:predicted permease
LILLALAVIVATAAGVFGERRLPWVPRAARLALGLMLYVLVPFVSFVNLAHVHLSGGGGVGIAAAWGTLVACGIAAWTIGRRFLHLSRPGLGALILCVILVNTGYLGLPMTVALLGTTKLASAVAYDQLISGPMLLLVGFAVGAWFGPRAGATGRQRLRAYITRNPPLVAAIAGLLAPASLAPEPLVRTSHVVVLALLLLGFFAVGVNLSAERRHDAAPLLERPDRRVAVALSLRLLATPMVLAFISAATIRLPSPYLLQAAMPTGVNSLIIGHAYGLDQRLIATAIVWSTALVLLVGVATVLL